MLLHALAGLQDSEVPPEIEKATGALEKSEEVSRSGSTNLQFDIATLTGVNFWRSAYRDFPDMDGPANLGIARRIAEDIVLLSEPTRSIAMARILYDYEYGPCWWPPRLLRALVMGGLASKAETAEERNRHLRELRELADYSAAQYDGLPARYFLERQLVELAATEGMIGAFQVDVQFLNDIRLREKLDRLLPRWNSNLSVIRETFSFLSRIWMRLPQESREDILAFVYNRFDAISRIELLHVHHATNTDIWLSYVDFLTSHAQDIPNGLRDKMAEDETILKVILRQWEAWSYEMQRIIPFALRLGGKTRSELEAFAWKAAEPPNREPILADMGITAILAWLYAAPVAETGWDSFKRRYVLEVVAFMTAAPLASHSFDFGGPEFARGVILGHLSDMFGPSSPEERMGVFECLRDRSGACMGPTSDEERARNYLQTFVNLSRQFPDWQTAMGFDLFRPVLGVDADGRNRADRMKGLSANIPPRSFPTLYQNLLDVATSHGTSRERLLHHLVDRTQNPGEFQQVVSFLRSYCALTSEIQEEFATTVLGDVHNLPSPMKIQGRLKRFSIDRFVTLLGEKKTEQNSMRRDITARFSLWQRGNLLHHLSTMAGFSTPDGIDAIRAFVMDLISSDAVAATAAAGARRLMNPTRYRAMEGVFPEAFIERWANGGFDRVIPMGELDVRPILEQDPLALRRAQYESAALQMGNHLGIPHISLLRGADLMAAIRRRIGDLQLDSVDGAKEWGRQMMDILDRMGRLEEVGADRIDAAYQFLRNHPRMVEVLDTQGNEIANDLKQFRKSIGAEALTGRAWIIITSDAADIVASGRHPVVTCQDPTRPTGANKHGEPANKAADGRFLYAKVVIARDARLVHGMAVLSPDAQEVARCHLEATMVLGQPVSPHKAHVNSHRLYSHAGFVYKQELDGALKRFGSEGLGIDSEQQMHIAFSGHGMRHVVPPLPDGRRVHHRDPF